MTKPAQLKLALDEEKRLREARDRARRDADELDDQIALAMARYEAANPGKSAHKEMADRLTSDLEHPVSVTQVYDWLSRRGGRRPPADLTDVLFDWDEKFAAWQRQKRGYEAPSRVVLIDPEEEIRQLRRALQEFGGAGEKKLQAIPTSLRPHPSGAADWDAANPAREVRRG